MEVLGIVGNLILSLAIGFCGGWAYHRYRFWKIKRYAPSAQIVSYHVGVTKKDYDNLSKTEADVAYFTRSEGEPPDGQAKG